MIRRTKTDGWKHPRRRSSAMRRRSLILALGTILLLACGGAPPLHRVAVSGLPPQISPDSCQSNFLAHALTRRFPSDFPVRNYEDLMEWERKIRVEIEEAADGEPVTHQHWRIAVDRVSKGECRFVEEWVESPEAVFERVREITADGSTAAGLSVTEIDGQVYPSGHVITIFSVGEGGNLLLLNSWVKEEGKPAFRSEIVRTKRIELKQFGSRYLVYRVAPVR